MTTSGDSSPIITKIEAEGIEGYKEESSEDELEIDNSHLAPEALTLRRKKGFNQDFIFQDDEFLPNVEAKKLEAIPLTSTLDKIIERKRIANNLETSSSLDYKFSKKPYSNYEDTAIINKDENISEKEKSTFFGHYVEEELAPDISFTDLNLSRSLLRAVTSMNFLQPTLIQARTIPLALLAKDICACAKTGSGKTAAFLLPVLERLLYRSKRAAVTRVLILSPTRELSLQCYDVALKLSQYTDITIAMIVGGVNLKNQEVELRRNPDIIIATPGRLIDHLHNTLSFSLEHVEVLIMDEADRLLELGFKEQLFEIVKKCPVGRQTMLFSATMTDEVEVLIGLSLHEPIRLFVDKNTETADNLQQEFVRVRVAKEPHRDAILLALCTRSFKSKCLIFFKTKQMAHKMKIIFGLFGLKAAELHGALNQTERKENLLKFKLSQADYLMSTDLAARGLDIEGIETVINFNMPSTLTQYIHRIGRTARAGKKGLAVTLVGENERKLLKEIIKYSKERPHHRILPTEVIQSFQIKISNMVQTIQEVLKEEKEMKLIEISEREAIKAQNMILHEKEIFSRPARSWFQSSKEKRAEKLSHEAQKLPEKKGNSPKTVPPRKEKRRLLAKKNRPVNGSNYINSVKRVLKRTNKPSRIYAFDESKENGSIKSNSKTSLNSGVKKTSIKTSKVSRHEKKEKTKQLFADKAAKKRRLKELRKVKSSTAFKSKKKFKRR
jgi:ATP-dependent RNA helicase DDX27